MVNNLFVGGLPYETKREDLEKMFAACGKVVNIKIIMDRETGKSKGFGFVEMSTEAEAKAAIEKLNGAPVGQRTIFVKEARPPEKRPPGGFPPRPSFGDRRPGGGEGRPSFGDRKPGGGFGDRKSGGGFGERPGKEGGRDRRWGKKSGGPNKWDDKQGGPKRGGKPAPEQEERRGKGAYLDDADGWD